MQTPDLIDITPMVSRGKDQKPTGPAISESFEQFRSTHPGIEETSYNNDRATWTLNSPLPKGAEIPDFSWELSDLGKKA